ncbi:MAG TPA: molybdopterin-binding protein, partial [Microbacterium sp.]|nr:molybdopterin-binding protein [Microbacterium sp.]
APGGACLSWDAEGTNLRIVTTRSIMRISARNQFKGTIIEVVKGATTAHVRIDVDGLIVTSSITNQAVDELGLAVGGTAYAVVKASDVMVAVED